MKRSLWLVLILCVLCGAVLPAAAQQRGSIVDLLAGDPQGQYTTVVAALEAAGLAETLSGEGEYTFFAPTNDAFDAALPALGLSIETLLGDTATLTTLLNYHLVSGDRIFFREMARAGSATTVQGEDVTFALEGGFALVNDATIIDVDNTADNGVMHGIDNVLVPPSLAGTFVAATPEATGEAADVAGETVPENAAFVRFAHFAADAPDVDVYIDGELSEVQGLAFMSLSDWVAVPSGVVSVAIAEAGAPVDATVLGPLDVRLDEATYNTIAVVGSLENDTLLAQPILEDYSPIVEGNTRATVFHAVERLQPVDVYVNGALLISQLAYPQTRGDNDGAFVIGVSAGASDIEFVISGSRAAATGDETAEPASGTVVFDLAGENLAANTNYFIALSGTIGNPQAVVVPVDMATIGSGT